MTTNTILLIGVGVVIFGVAAFSWWFENAGDNQTEESRDEEQK